ncbi:MAG: nucleotide-binding protein [Bacteroidales bacterium]|jgi:CRP/FNR family cyclic AMP-dependent transcriptional regulator|nr:nucleotide-binding protein [Bacteroidales bacterium]
MIKRFQGEESFPNLISALRQQMILHDNKQICEKLAGLVKLKMLEEGESLINQDEIDNDLYFILTGKFSVLVNGREVAIRDSGQHVGEMALIDPSARRSAAVKAIEQSVVATISECDFTNIANHCPRIWRLISRELSDRIRQRGSLVRPVNPRPVLFIGSSAESLTIAREVRAGFNHDNIIARLWSDGGIFGASGFPIEDLEDQVTSSDFAVLVIGPDDKVHSRGQEFDAPRDNVIFELGLFMGALTRRRAFIVSPRGIDIKIPSDLLGIIALTYKTGSEDELPSLIAPVCDEIRKIINRTGAK